MATALVLMMTPALGLFYAGLTRSKNTLNTFMMSVASLGVVTIAWVVFGYSLAFDEGNGLHRRLPPRLPPRCRPGRPRRHSRSPRSSSSSSRRASASSPPRSSRAPWSSACASFPTSCSSSLWSLIVFAPLAHWVWGGGWLADRGVLDFAGGVPVEMASGFSALAAAVAVGARKDFGRQAMLPHNAVYVLLGAGLLWFGWFGFNGGSALASGGSAALAFANTLIAPAGTLTVWMLIDLARGGRATAVGAATAIVVGAVAITPAAGYIGPMEALLLGRVAAVPSYAFIVWRAGTRLDESLDVLAAHGLGGVMGTLFIGFFAKEAWNGLADGLVFGNASQLGEQALAVVVAIAYSFTVSYVLFRALGLVMTLRVGLRDEGVGLDVVEHGEEAYTSGEGHILIRENPVEV